MRCTGPPYALWLLVLSTFALHSLVSAGSVNRTIDDVHGDSVTGAQVQYLPAVPPTAGPLWVNQTSCAGCSYVPDATVAHEGTWTAARYLAAIGSMSINMKFSGTAIYLYFILPNFVASSGQESTVRCDFFVDGAPVGSFTHDSDGSGQFAYNTLVYKNTTIPDGDHTLLIETTGADPAIIIFDYMFYTVNVPDPPTASDPPAAAPPPPSSSTASAATTQMEIATDGPDGTDSTTSEFAPPSTQTDTVLAFPTAPNPSQSSTYASSDFPFVITPLPPDATASPSTPFALPPDSVQDTTATQRSSHVLTIVGAVAGGVILVVFALVVLLLYRRRRRQRQLRVPQETISVFDLLSHNSPPPQPPVQRRPRPLPTPPAGRSIDATPDKTDSAFGPGSGMHSAQSSVSVYSETRSDLHIHIPMASFRNADRAASPLSLVPSHSHSNSYSHGHSPITRNGVPIPPHEEELVRGLILGARSGGGSLSLRRGSVGSEDFTPTSTMAMTADEDLWDAPVIHVDSGIRISRAMMDLPPVYTAP